MKSKVTISIAETVKVTLVVVAMCSILYSVHTESQLPANTAAQKVQSSQLLTQNK